MARSLIAERTMVLVRGRLQVIRGAVMRREKLLQLAGLCTHSFALISSMTAPASSQELSLSPILSIGVLDGVPELTFGHIEDLAVDGRGAVYVLDQMAREIRMFDEKGAHLQTVGREGGGPGEYNLPTAITLSPSRELYVADQMSMRITVYQISDSLEYGGDFRTEFGVRDMCFLDGRLYALGFHEGHVIHEIALTHNTGELEQSFGEPYWSHPLRQHRVNHLLCLSELKLVLVAAAESPVVRSYTADGDPSWSFTLSDHYPLTINELVDGRVEYLFPDDRPWYHTLLSLVPLPDSLVAVQLGRVGMGVRPDETTDIETRVLSIDGNEIGRQSGSLRFFLFRPPSIFGASTDPFPHVVIGRLEQR